MPADKLAREHAQMLVLIRRVAASVTYTAFRQEARALLTELDLEEPGLKRWRVMASSRVTNPATNSVAFVMALTADAAKLTVERSDSTLTVTAVTLDRRDPL